MYEERCNAWEALASMRWHRAHHGVATLNGLLYAAGGIGGRTAQCETVLSTVECYDPSIRRWIPLAPMHEYDSLLF